ncbi:MAG: sensor domain-containing diguanylate cyclase [Candidatus Thiodiazotropha sp. (ex Monitilora ramsayi)]|nr:sensor domain-containing diguanylate cyclase [Candidatus Thiodiazotropha sp. (ex Monitilora ramsayi)]
MRFLKVYWIGGLLALVFMVLATEWVVNLLKSNQMETQRIEVLNRVVTLRARLEGEINSTLHLTRGLIAYVAINPEVDNREFDALASEITSVGRNIRNIGLAKDNVITHLFPLAGNEAALGLEYEKMPDQWPAIQRAIDQKGTIVAGPVGLVQGGQAFIARTPIYTRGGLGGHLSVHKPAYWGIASIVIDIPTLFESAGLKQEMDGIRFALRGKDAKGTQGEMILGDSEVFTSDPILQSILLPNGEWRIAAIPLGGWQSQASHFWMPRLIGWVGAIFIGLLITALLRAREINRSLALLDPLTELPNRRLLEDRFDQMIARCKRSGRGFAVYYIDLDDFKEVNDRYGHKVGDALLVEVAKRLQAGIRRVDTAARIGGDEFIVLAEGIQDAEAKHNLSESLLSGLRGKVFIDGNRLPLRASVGSSQFPSDGETLDELLKTSDRKMYEAKHQAKIYQISTKQ